MANRWWVPAVAAAAVVLVGAGTVLALRGDGEQPAAATPAPAPAPVPAPAGTLDQLRVRNGDLVTASGTVLAAPGRPVRFCAPAPVAGVGYDGPERPPDCSLGVDLVDADPGRLTEPKAYQWTRWGRAGITGRYENGTITVTAQSAPADDDPYRGTDLPDGTPCPAPTGGWHPGRVDQGQLGAVTALVDSHPATYGEVAMTYPDGPPSGPTAAPAYSDATEVVMVTTTLPPATAERELRAGFTGNLCVRPAVRSRAATDAVWTRISPQDRSSDKDWQRYGVYQGGPDYQAGRVRVSLIVLDDAAYRWLTGAAAGTTVVDAQPWLRPAG